MSLNQRQNLFKKKIIEIGSADVHQIVTLYFMVCLFGFLPKLILCDKTRPLLKTSPGKLLIREQSLHAALTFAQRLCNKVSGG